MHPRLVPSIVITSYSIHYTKLYEHSAEQLKQVTHSEGDQRSSVCGFAPPAQASRQRMQRVHRSFIRKRRSERRDRIPSIPVITSYSIHYTKLYDPALREGRLLIDPVPPRDLRSRVLEQVAMFSAKPAPEGR